MAYVTYEKRGHVAVITLNRPERNERLGACSRRGVARGGGGVRGGR